MSRIDPVFELFRDELMGAEAQSRRLAEFAAEQIAEVEASNAKLIGKAVRPKVFVDDQLGKPLPSVRPDGEIRAEFGELLDEVLEWIGEQLLLTSPRLTGRYMDSHVLTIRTMAGEDIPYDPLRPLADGEWYIFTNTQPYARKIEPKTFTTHRRDRSGPVGTRRRWKSTTRIGDGQSQQAPDGVYQAISAVAARRFGNLARVTYGLEFSYETGVSQPYISVRGR